MDSAAMKKLLLAFILSATCSHALADAYDLLLQQRNSLDTATITRVPAHPLTPGILAYDSNTLLPLWVTLSSGLSISSGVLTLSVPAQVNSDWNSVSGLSRILNRPTLATVALTGNYGDLTATPTLATHSSPTILRLA